MPSTALAIEHESNRDILDAIDHAHQQLVAAEIGELVGIVRAADRWRIDQEAVGEGIERCIQPGHDGTPLIAEFLALELGPLLGVSYKTALGRLASALDLRHRHPQLWAAVLAGSVRVWQANKICFECSHLPYRAALRVDAALADTVGKLPWTRVLKALPGQIMQADPETARKREQARRQSRSIRISPIEDGHVNLFGIVDAADGIKFNEVLNHVATLFPAEPDKPLSRDIDRRRSLAFGIVTQDAYNRLYGDQPLFELAALDRQNALARQYVPNQAANDHAAASWQTSGQQPHNQQSLDEPSGGRQSPGQQSPDEQPLGEQSGGRQHLDEQSPGGRSAVNQPGQQAAGQSGDPEHEFIPRKPVPCTLIVHISADDPALARADLASNDCRSTSGVARVEGWGPILTKDLPEFLTGAKVTIRPIIDSEDIRPVDCYETPAKMRFVLNQRNPIDVFPYGTLRASRCDADHTIPYIDGRTGQTHLGNLGPLSRTAHRAKTHGKWRLEQPVPGVFHWTSPYGYQYRATANGAIRITVPESR